MEGGRAAERLERSVSPGFREAPQNKRGEESAVMGTSLEDEDEDKDKEGPQAAAAASVKRKRRAGPRASWLQG